MSWFFLDTHLRGDAAFGWLSSEKSRMWRHEGRGNGLLAAVTSKVKREDMSGAQGVCVVAGPGPFSAIRMGVLVANVLSRTFGLPLYAVRADEAADVQALGKRLAQGELASQPYVAPIYDSEPNITLPKT